MKRTGMTLVEVAVALLLLSVGALALAGGISHALRARERALGSALALAAAESWLETWRAGPWPLRAESGAFLASWGSRGGLLKWETVPLGPCLVQARVEVSPPGAGSAPVVLITRRFQEGENCVG